jgi:hypothetical protein
MYSYAVMRMFILALGHNHLLDMVYSPSGTDLPTETVD